MNTAIAPLLLLVAACLEVGGDAIVRVGLKTHSGVPQLALVVLGGAVLLAYGIFVNIAPADFGRLLGVYVVLFFVVAQLVNLLAFGIRPGIPILVGGANEFFFSSSTATQRRFAASRSPITPFASLRSTAIPWPAAGGTGRLDRQRLDHQRAAVCRRRRDQ